MKFKTVKPESVLDEIQEINLKLSRAFGKLLSSNGNTKAEAWEDVLDVGRNELNYVVTYFKQFELLSVSGGNMVINYALRDLGYSNIIMFDNEIVGEYDLKDWGENPNLTSVYVAASKLSPEEVCMRCELLRGTKNDQSLTWQQVALLEITKRLEIVDWVDSRFNNKFQKFILSVPVDSPEVIRHMSKNMKSKLGLE